MDLLSLKETKLVLIILLYSIVGASLIYGINPLLCILNDKSKKSVIKLLIVVSPIWITLIILQMIVHPPFTIDIFQFSIPDILTELSLLVMIVTYCIMVFWWQESAQYLVQSFKELFPYTNRQNANFWTKIDFLKKRRDIVIILLIGLIILIGFLDVIFLQDYLIKNKILTNPETLYIILSTIIIFIAAILFVSHTRSFPTDSYEVGTHQDSTEINDSTINLAIALGIPVPNLIIIADPTPTAFSIRKLFHKATIYITTGMLNLANRAEQEAVLGHELSHIYSGFTSDYAVIDMLIDILKAFSLILLLVFLIDIHPFLLVFWFLSLAYVSFAFREYSVTTMQYILNIFTPTFTIVRFIGAIIYFSLTYNEDLFADIKSIQLTRNPRPLFTILQKLQAYRQVSSELPLKLAPLYFTAETVIGQNIISAQPPIQMRLDLIHELDFNLIETNVPPAEAVRCPSCNIPMSEVQATNQLGTKVTVNRCSKCGSVWFDQYELFMIADLTELSQNADNTAGLIQDTDGMWNCPRCGTSMIKLSDAMIPQDIHIYRCESCKGNWLARHDLQSYTLFRKSKIAAQENNFQIEF